mgnify:CR=1 FL=1
MRKRIFRGASFILLTLSIPAIGWGLKEKATISDTPVLTENVINTPVVSKTVTAEEQFSQHITEIYDSLNLKSVSLDFDVFQKALTGYYNLKGDFKVSADKQIVSIVDFTKPSSQKRLWIVDLANKKLLFHTFVAHGRGSGGLNANKFSNTAESHQSSLGFYVTDATYTGKHGLSLRLKGVDKGFNTNALARAIVVHGADYVNADRVNTAYMGRSQGCPALPRTDYMKVIDLIKDGSALLVYSPDEDYLNSSQILNS